MRAPFCFKHSALVMTEIGDLKTLAFPNLSLIVLV